MKKEKYVGKVSPVRTDIRLSKGEVAVAVFQFAYGRPPTAEEVPRVTVNVNENHHGHTGAWELVLGVEQEAPVCPRCLEELGSTCIEPPHASAPPEAPEGSKAS